MDRSYTAQAFRKTKTERTSTLHSCTCAHINVHIIYGYRSSLPRSVKKPV